MGHDYGAIYSCQGLGSTNNGDLWLGTDPTAPTLSPGAAAAEVVKSMPLKAINIQIVPEAKADKLGAVGLPVWMWTRPTATTWGPQTKTAAAGGQTVTLTAKVTRVVWDMGDGNSVTCTSPGTPWNVSYGLVDSPDCGYRYVKTSAHKPDSAYTVTAHSYWNVHWVGGGQTGDMPLDFQNSVRIRVGELQAIEVPVT